MRGHTETNCLQMGLGHEPELLKAKARQRYRGVQAHSIVNTNTITVLLFPTVRSNCSFQYCTNHQRISLPDEQCFLDSKKTNYFRRFDLNVNTKPDIGNVHLISGQIISQQLAPTTFCSLKQSNVFV